MSTDKASQPKPPAEGVRVIHRTGCQTKAKDRNCPCGPTFQTAIYQGPGVPRDRKNHKTHRAAVDYLKVKAGEKIKGEFKPTLRAPTLYAFVEDVFLPGIKSGAIEATRKGTKLGPYKPSTVRSYERILRLRILPRIGSRRLSEIARGDLARLVDHIQADRDGKEPLGGSSIRNVINVIGAIYTEAIRRDIVQISPVMGYCRPAADSERGKHVCLPLEVVDRIDRLQTAYDKALIALAAYAGLRRGEILALRWSDVDFGRREIRIAGSMDAVEGIVKPKSKKGARTVPMFTPLHTLLLDHRVERARLGLDGNEQLVFGVSDRNGGTKPPALGTPWRRIKRCWKGLPETDLHSFRHSFASWCADAGYLITDVSRWCGHASVSITVDLYGGKFEKDGLEVIERGDQYLKTGRRAS